MLQKIQLIPEKVSIRSDVNVISALSDRWNHYKIVASFQNSRILKLIVLLTAPGKKYIYNEFTENDLFWKQIKI